jgi:hypothetical protein
MLNCFISHSILRVNLHFKAFKFEISLVQPSDCCSKKSIKPVTYSNALEFVILCSILDSLTLGSTRHSPLSVQTDAYRRLH